ncbi:GrpB family protein [Peribacillus frigoritolerans]|nr:GrpB family protein [Peribacillus frigoritolerans]
MMPGGRTESLADVFFRKGGDERTHHIHMFQKGHEEIARHLAFRDYLRAHPDEAQEYSRLKLRLAAEFPIDINGYVNGKNDFIKKVDEKSETLGEACWSSC